MISFNRLKNIVPLTALLITLVLSCSKEADLVNFLINTPVADTSDQNLKTFRFSFSGDVETMVLYSGESGKEFCFSQLWLNSIDFINKLNGEGTLAGKLEYKYADPGSYQGGIITDTFDIIYMPLTRENLVVDYCWTIIEDKYSGREYVRAIRPEVFSNPVDTFFTMSLSSQGNVFIPYNEGVPVDAKLRYVDIQYSEAGQMLATMVGTDVDRKQYESDGYITERVYFADEYNINRSYQDIVINVGEELVLNFVSGDAKNLRFAIQEELKEKAKKLKVNDFELRDANNNLLPIKSLNYLGDFTFLDYDFELKPEDDFVQGATYKLRPVNTFYGDLIECIPNL